MGGIELARQAVRDVRKLDAPERRRVQRALEHLQRDAASADVKALAGAAPWLRLRVGERRILFRPMTGSECGPGILVARVVDRRDLERAVRSLQA